MKALTLALATSLVGFQAYAESQTADQLVASKRQADMTYQQLMEIMGAASAMIQEGIVRQNPEMTRMGAAMIADHPAPNHKPWSIMPAVDQAAFKQTLLSFDEVLHTEATRIEDAAASRDWPAASRAAHALTNACVTCHSAWKGRVSGADSSAAAQSRGMD
jgi:hypothetical protein